MGVGMYGRGDVCGYMRVYVDICGCMLMYVDVCGCRRTIGTYTYGTLGILIPNKKGPQLAGQSISNF